MVHRSHACVHVRLTVQTASAAASLLKGREAELPGTVMLLFQPAEEGGAGGKRFVEAGALEGVLGIHGIHVWPGISAGIITSRVIIAIRTSCRPASSGQLQC